jgi:hypothetical protein
MAWSIEVYDTSAADSPDCSVKDCRGYAKHHCTVRYEQDGQPRMRYGRVCAVHLAQTRAWYAKKRGEPPIEKPAEELSGPPAPAQPRRPARTWPIPPGVRPSMCSSCAAPVFWIVTENNRRMPIDAEGATAGQSHFASCKYADEHRKPRKRA